VAARSQHTEPGGALQPKEQIQKSSHSANTQATKQTALGTRPHAPLRWQPPWLCGARRARPPTAARNRSNAARSTQPSEEHCSPSTVLLRRAEPHGAMPAPRPRSQRPEDELSQKRASDEQRPSAKHHLRKASAVGKHEDGNQRYYNAV